TLGQFHVGGRLSQEALGRSWEIRDRQLQDQMESLTQAQPNLEIPLASLVPGLIAANSRGAPWKWLLSLSQGSGPTRPGTPGPEDAQQLTLPLESGFLPADVAQARRLQGASVEEVEDTLQQLRRIQAPFRVPDEIRWIHYHRLAGGIPRLGEIARRDKDHF